jgi:hypothetical protein
MAHFRGSMPDDAAVLDVWERSSALERPWRELALLELTGDEPVEAAARLPLGERDRRLLALRTSLFGRWIACETRCGACEERLELELDGEGLAAPPAGSSHHRHTPDVGGGIRPPDSTDIAAALGADDPAAVILERCMDPPPMSMSQGVRVEAARRMAELDPGAELWLEATCPGCGSAWTVLLDPAAIVVEEVDRHARRILREVDQLARAYGWREPDVLALGPARRRAYLGLVAS